MENIKVVTNNVRKEPIRDMRALRVLYLLERIAAANHPVTLSQLALRQSIPKATVARLLEMLVENDYLNRLPGGGGFILGPQAARMAIAALGNSTFKRKCRSILAAVVQSIGESCNLTALEDDHVIYLERVETQELLRLNIDPGARHPLHCTAGGKLFLASMPSRERAALLDRIDLTAMTSRTLTNRKALEAELALLERRKIGIDDEEFVRGMVGLAVPVPLENQPITVCIVCHAATARTSLDDLLARQSELEDAAKRMAELFMAPDSTPE